MKWLFCHPSQGGSMMYVAVQHEPFDVIDEEAKLQVDAGHCGAIVTFKGVVRGAGAQKPLSHLYLEHFPQVTEQEIARIVAVARERWHFASCRVIHRVGDLFVGEPIVLVMVASKHRKEAFHAAEFIMDYLKTEAPFWKKEYFKDGDAQWVAAKSSDEEEKQRWVKGR